MKMSLCMPVRVADSLEGCMEQVPLETQKRHNHFGNESHLCSSRLFWVIATVPSFVSCNFPRNCVRHMSFDGIHFYQLDGDNIRPHNKNNLKRVFFCFPLHMIIILLIKLSLGQKECIINSVKSTIFEKFILGNSAK